MVGKYYVSLGGEASSSQRSKQTHKMMGNDEDGNCPPDVYAEERTQYQ